MRRGPGFSRSRAPRSRGPGPSRPLLGPSSHRSGPLEPRVGLGEGGEAPPSRRRDPTGRRGGPVPERAAREVSAPGGWGDDLERHRRLERGWTGPLDPRGPSRRARGTPRPASSRSAAGPTRDGGGSWRATPWRRRTSGSSPARGSRGARESKGVPPDRDEDSTDRQRHDLSEVREALRGPRRRASGAADTVEPVTGEEGGVGPTSVEQEPVSRSGGDELRAAALAHRGDRAGAPPRRRRPHPGRFAELRLLPLPRRARP